MKKALLLICFLFIAKSAFSEDSIKSNGSRFTDRNTVFKIDIFTPAIGLETRLINCNTLLIAYHPGFIIYTHGGVFSSTEIKMVHQFKGALRFFYNIDSRINRGKRTDKFAGDFLSIYSMYGIVPKILPNYFTIGPTWGLQRNWKGIVHFSFEIGLGFNIAGEDEYGAVTVIGDLKLGFAF